MVNHINKRELIMEKYISKSILVAEIERRIKEYQSTGDDYWFPVIENLKVILSFLDTLEVKEVQEPTAADRGMVEEIIINLKRVEQDYHIDLTKEIKWLRSKVKKAVSRTPADIEAAMQEVEEKSRAFTEAHQGENSDKILAQMRGEEPVSEELEEAAKNVGQKYFPDEYNIWARPNYEAVKAECAFMDGAMWQKTNLWKPADGNDLPEIDKEVIVLVGIKNPVTTDSMWGCEVAFAHRPNPDGWDGKSITTGKVEHYDVQTYDKGGWNIPDVKYWLDLDIPETEE